MGAADPAARGDSAAPAQIAKAAFHRLALAKLAPTPENYARAYAEESGAAATAALPERAKPLIERMAVLAAEEGAPRQALVQALMNGQWELAHDRLLQGEAATKAFAEQWGQLVERLVRGIEQPSRQWTPARRRDSLQRVLSGSRNDLKRLAQRLSSLISAWETDAPADDQSLVDDVDAATAAAPVPAAPPIVDAASSATTPVTEAHAWPRVADELRLTVDVALPGDDPRARALADELAGLSRRVGDEGATAELVAAVATACEHARRLLQHRHRLIDDLATLCRELGAGLTAAAEDEGWTQGQSHALQARLADGMQSRNVRAATALMADIRGQQQRLKTERQQARDALKAMISTILEEVGELDQHTERFAQTLGRHAKAVEEADTLEGLSAVVREMVADSRSVQRVVREARERIQGEHSRAAELQAQVQALESELRRLSDEATTDALTQVANRRGLMAAFEAEVARAGRASGSARTLSLALIDIDNFKKLNDTLGHAAGDMALKTLAAAVRERLRQGDHLARFGGEEFVIVLPSTAGSDAQELLTRLQRSLSSSLFMHGEREVFVTFSAGVTEWREGEPLETALARADEGLYEAKRTGKNRSCLA